MNKNLPDQRDWHERRIEEQREKDRAASRSPLGEGAKAARMAGAAASAKRSSQPGTVGLANQARPGIGTRQGEEPAASKPKPAAKPRKAKGGEGKPRATRRGYEEPRPEPREQAPDSLAHEQERQTGMSGQSSGT